VGVAGTENEIEHLFSLLRGAVYQAYAATDGFKPYQEAIFARIRGVLADSDAKLAEVVRQVPRCPSRRFGWQTGRMRFREPYI